MGNSIKISVFKNEKRGAILYFDPQKGNFTVQYFLASQAPIVTEDFDEVLEAAGDAYNWANEVGEYAPDYGQARDLDAGDPEFWEPEAMEILAAVVHQDGSAVRVIVETLNKGGDRVLEDVVIEHDAIKAALAAIHQAQEDMKP